MFADERAHGVGPRIAHLGHQQKIKDIQRAVDAWEVVDLLDEIQKPRHVHQPEERRRDGDDPGGVAAGDELAQAQAKHEQDQEPGLEVVHPRGGAMDAQMPCQV